MFTLATVFLETFTPPPGSVLIPTILGVVAVGLAAIYLIIRTTPSSTTQEPVPAAASVVSTERDTPVETDPEDG